MTVLMNAKRDRDDRSGRVRERQLSGRPRRGRPATGRRVDPRATVASSTKEVLVERVDIISIEPGSTMAAATASGQGMGTSAIAAPVSIRATAVPSRDARSRSRSKASIWSSRAIVNMPRGISIGCEAKAPARPRQPAHDIAAVVLREAGRRAPRRVDAAAALPLQQDDGREGRDLERRPGPRDAAPDDDDVRLHQQPGFRLNRNNIP